MKMIVFNLLLILTSKYSITITGILQVSSIGQLLDTFSYNLVLYIIIIIPNQQNLSIRPVSEIKKKLLKVLISI